MESVLTVIGEAGQLISEKLATWTQAFIINIPNLLVALGVVFSFYLVAKGVHGFFVRRMNQTSLKNSTLPSLIAKTLEFVVILAGFFIALSVLKLDKAVLSALAGLGILGVALGFAFQDIASNFMSGLLLAIRSPFRVGDVIEVSGVTGTVKALRLRDTEIDTFEGQKVYIPNKDVIGDNLKNFSNHSPRRIDLTFGIDYSASIEEAQNILLEVARADAVVLKDPSPICICTELGESSVNLSLRVWIQYPGSDFLALKDRLFKQGKKALDGAKIGIPFAVRTIEFANVEKLAQVLGKSLSPRKEEWKEDSKDFIESSPS